MTSFTIAFEALATYILPAETSPSTVSVFPLNGLGGDNRDKIFEYFQDPRSNQSRTFQDATHINMFSFYNGEQQVECRQLSPLLLRQWINTTFETNRPGPPEEGRRASTRQRRPSSMLDGYTQERDRNRRRVNPSNNPPAPGNGTSTSHAPTNGTSNNAVPSFTDFKVMDPSNPMFNAMNNFVHGIYQGEYNSCSRCNERKRGVQGNICKDCSLSIAKHPYIPKMGHENDMDPFWSPNPVALSAFHTLERECPLTDIEQMLIARHLPIMKVYRLKGRDNGNLAFSGNVINVSQGIEQMVSILPRTLAQLPVIVVRRGTGNPSDYRDFNISTHRVMRWLIFLKAHNPGYADIEINTSWNEAANIFESVSAHLSSNTEGTTTNQGSPSDGDTEEDDPVDPLLPETNDPTEDEILETGASGVEELRPDELEEISRIVWPEQGNAPLDEYNLPHLLTRSWPTLFPFGRGDITNLTHRVITVDWNEAIKHYQNYARFNGSRYYYPFASNHRFMFYVHDVDERHRIQSSCSVYLNKNTVDSNMTIADLRNISLHSSSEDFALQRRMQRFASNILGSSAYMAQRKSELMSLISSKAEASNNNTSSTSTNEPTIWYTLSLANYYWQDLHKILGPPLPRQDGETIEDYCRRYRIQCKKDYNDNPHIVDEVFCHRVKEFIKHFFGPNGLEAFWVWYRVEWQKRGNIHVHGLARLKNDPGLASLASKVMKGRKASQILRVAKQIVSGRGDDISIFPTDELISKTSGDELIPLLETQMHSKLSENMLTQEQIDTLIEDVSTGNTAATTICAFRDSILSTDHPSPPADAANVIRDEGVTPSFISHPCFTCHTASDNTHVIRPEIYTDLLDNCMRHRHHPTYCMKNNDSCRFHFPHTLRTENGIIMKEIPYRMHRDGLHGTLRKTIIEFQFKSNDSWLNSHSPVALLGWGANMDMSILIDPHAVMEYVAKYATKNEPCSSGFQQMLRAAIRKRQEQDQLETPKVLRSVFNSMCRRDKCTQEVAHLVASRPYVSCSHQFITINLTSSLREINVNAEEESAPAIRDNISDLYLKRMYSEHWADSAIIPPLTELSSMSLSIFAKKFTSTKEQRRSKITHRTNSKSVIPVFLPEYSANPTSPHYWVYSLLCLWKYVPHTSRQSLYGGDTKTDFSNLQTRLDQYEISISEKENIIASWENFLRSVSEEDALLLPDGINREIQRIRREGNTDTPTFGSLSPGYDLEEEDAEYSTHFLGPEDEAQDIAWAENEDWKTPKYEYEDGDLDVASIRANWELVNNPELPETSPVNAVNPNVLQQCNPDQSNAVAVWRELCSTYALGNNNVSNNNTASNAMIVNGVAGTGKSHVIKSMVVAASQIPQNVNKKVLIMAPTGKASIAANGFTLHSSFGLLLPVRNGKTKVGILQGQRLNDLQDRFQHICGIIIDEYSMLSLVDLYWINSRLQQALKNNLMFGGIPIAFIGDPGQLPPVGGHSLWVTRPRNIPLSGHPLVASTAYLSIKNVIKLHVVQRQTDPNTFDFLLAVRDGKIEQRHWRWFNDTCSETAIRRRGYISRFEGSDCVHIYSTNKEVFEYNHSCLQKLNRPINKLTAIHDSAASKKRASDSCESLPPVLYLTRESSIMLLRNISTPYGLVNGSSGTVKDFMYGEESTLPEYIIIEFPTYSGPPFFRKPEQRSWVPIPAYVCHWGEGNRNFRKSFPITLAYAITIHKSQGMTIVLPVWVSLGDKDIEHGSTYVALSRVTDFRNLCIGPGVTLERLVKISEGIKLKVRLKEDERLDRLVTQTKERFHLT